MPRVMSVVCHVSI